MPWTRPSPAYSPPDFTAPFVLTAAWADPDIGQQGFNPQWNKLGTNQLELEVSTNIREVSQSSG